MYVSVLFLFFLCSLFPFFFLFFFFNDTATTEIYTLSLHDALPICFALRGERETQIALGLGVIGFDVDGCDEIDRKSTRLNSSHANISYAVFCLKKKKTRNTPKMKAITAKAVIKYVHKHKLVAAA